MMHRAVVLYIGVAAVVIASFIGLTYLPNEQLRGLEQVVDDMDRAWPVEPTGTVAIGREVYIDLGCLYCHSQQVRPEGFGADIDRGWGSRRSVARDFMFDQPPLLGTMRTGPDLASIAVRQPSREWHYLHLYQPTLTSPGSTMAPFPFLFERFDPDELRVGEGRDEPPDDAVRVPGPDGTEEGGYWIVPTDRARALVDYLLSLDQSYDVPEVP